MKVEFIRDVFNAGTKIFETGKQYEGDLARYVRRGDAIEAKGKGGTTEMQVAPDPVDNAKGRKE